ncbi:MAG: hypothetical protein II767_04225 [Proteobacteria bacterium]|nr:hypothetical protein [Pseudomonadota bacterium]MBQ4359441.1 hypothetical protein [Pseudomonadota bacterium]
MIATLVIVLIGLAMQFLFPGTTDSPFFLFVAACLILFGPTVGMPGRDKIREEDKGAMEINKWHTLSKDEQEDILQHIKYDTFGKLELSGLAKLFAALVSTPFVVIACIIGVFLTLDESYNLGALVFDIVCVPRAIFYMIYGCSPSDAKSGERAYHIGKKIDGISDVIRYEDSLRNCKANVQVQLTKKGESTDIRNAQVQIVPNTAIDNLLCAQISISENKVREDYFPYAYLVFVFKGPALAQKKAQQVRHKITDILHQDAPHFQLKAEVTDDNSVFVITKQLGACVYHTNIKDCEDLVAATDSIVRYFSKLDMSQYA